MTAVLQPFIMLFLLIALGGVFNFIEMMDMDFTQKLSKLVIHAAFPAMLFTSVYNNVTWDVIRVGIVFPLAAITACIILAISAHLTGKRFGLTGKTFSTYQILCTNGNNIFLPVPIILSLFGQEYLVYAFLFELGAGLFYWTYGVSLFQDKVQLNPGKILNVNLLALILGLICGLLEVRIPQVVTGGLEIIANLTVGSAMLIIGSLVVSLLRRGVGWRAEILGVIGHRLLLSPLIGVILLKLIPMDRNLAVVLMLLLSMPPLASTALVASTFNADEELAALGVVIPTLISLISVPFILSCI